MTIIRKKKKIVNWNILVTIYKKNNKWKVSSGERILVMN